MKTKIILLLLVLSASVYGQQSIESVLQQIEENNTTLLALRSEADAEKIGNKTGLYPDNPEVEYSYQWGNEVTPGDKTTLSVMQSIDFPTAYYHRKKVSDSQNRQVDLKYRIARKDILFEAKKLCIELTFTNASCSEQKTRFIHAQQLAEAYQTLFEKGEVSVIDLNKANFNLLNVRKELNNLQAERDYLREELARCNGGLPVEFDNQSFPQYIPGSWDEYYSPEENLALVYYQQQIQLNKESEKLQRSLNLPKISAGYVNEKVRTAEFFQGIAIGVSIPLFENKNTVRTIKANTQAVMIAGEDESLRYRNTVEALSDKAKNYAQTLESYNQLQLTDDMAGLLKKSLELGQLSLIEYLQELSIYYEMIDNRLQLQRDLHLTLAELSQWKL